MTEHHEARGPTGLGGVPGLDVAYDTDLLPLVCGYGCDDANARARRRSATIATRTTVVSSTTDEMRCACASRLPRRRTKIRPKSSVSRYHSVSRRYQIPTEVPDLRYHRAGPFRGPVIPNGPSPMRVVKIDALGIRRSAPASTKLRTHKREPARSGATVPNRDRGPSRAEDRDRMRQTQRDAIVGFVLRELAAVEQRLGEAHKNCRDWNADGYPTTSLPQIGGKGNPTDRTGNTAMRPGTFDREAKNADRALTSLYEATQALVAFINANSTPTSGIYCGNLHCDRIMTGIDNDRPRGELRECPRCYIHRRRHQAPWPHHALSPAVQAEPAESVTVPDQ